jgi:hypothetical protein
MYFIVFSAFGRGWVGVIAFKHANILLCIRYKVKW